MSISTFALILFVKAFFTGQLAHFLHDDCKIAHLFILHLFYNTFCVMITDAAAVGLRVSFRGLSVHSTDNVDTDR